MLSVGDARMSHCLCRVATRPFWICYWQDIPSVLPLAIDLICLQSNCPPMELVHSVVLVQQFGISYQNISRRLITILNVFRHISLRTSARSTRSSSVPLLRVPLRRTLFTILSFSTATPLTWNSLPPAVLNCKSLYTFKSRLKTHLFSTAFC